MFDLTNHSDQELLRTIFAAVIDTHTDLDAYLPATAIYGNDETMAIVNHLLALGLIENISYLGFKLTDRGKSVYCQCNLE